MDLKKKLKTSELLDKLEWEDPMYILSCQDASDCPDCAYDADPIGGSFTT